MEFSVVSVCECVCERLEFVFCVFVSFVRVFFGLFVEDIIIFSRVFLELL